MKKLKRFWLRILKGASCTGVWFPDEKHIRPELQADLRAVHQLAAEGAVTKEPTESGYRFTIV